VNEIILLGRLGRDPELKSTPSGQSVANFSLAIDESYTNRAGEKVKRTLWITVKAWAKTGELCAKYLKKGRQALVTGRLDIRQYEKDGEKRYATEVIAQHVEFVGDRPRDDDAGHADSYEEPAATAPADDADIPF